MRETQAPVTCSECQQDKPDVRERVDPFEEDVNNRAVFRALCDACDIEIANEI